MSAGYGKARWSVYWIRNGLPSQYISVGITEGLFILTYVVGRSQRDVDRKGRGGMKLWETGNVWQPSHCVGYLFSPACFS